MESAYDAVVVGSGFGGAITACSLAEQGWRVCVLKRGRRFGPAEIVRAINAITGRGRVALRFENAATKVGCSDRPVTHNDGLYVLDGSIVSTSLGVNPSKTIAALAERGAERLAAEGRP